jgi:hypothetical protein
MTLAYVDQCLPFRWRGASSTWERAAGRSCHLRGVAHAKCYYVVGMTVFPAHHASPQLSADPSLNDDS